MIAALLIFLATYLAVALGRVPGLRVDRAGAALVGASLMVGSGVLNLDEAYRAIDLNTLVLLLGMMILVAALRLAGFFALAAHGVARCARHPLGLLAGIVLTSGVLSAFLVNDTVCLMLTPLVAEVVLALRREPLPYLLSVAMASNIGSVATVTGNPQNVMIASFSGISYGDFAAALSPVAALGLLLLLILLVLSFSREFLTRRGFEMLLPAPRFHPTILAKSLLATVIVIACFFAGIAPAKVAIIGGALLLLSLRLRPERIYREIDWALLLLFAGLFIVVRGLEKGVLTPDFLNRAEGLALGTPAVLSAVAAVLSNLVSNVPAVLVLKPFVQNVADPRRAWLILAMASTLAGNFTLLGSVANLIVVERARRQGIAIGFWSYLKLGLPVAAITIAVGVWWLS